MIYKICKCECGKQFRDKTGKGQCKCGKQAQVGEMWYVKYIDSTGHPREKAVSSRLQDAKAFKISVTHKRNIGESTEAEPVIMLHAAIDAWYSQREFKSTNTQSAYSVAIKRIKATMPDSDMVKADLSKLLNSGGNPGTLNICLNVLKMVYKHTLSKCESNSNNDMKWMNRKCRSVCVIKLNPTNVRDRVLDEDEVNQLLQNTSGALNIIILTAVLTGLRIGNVLSLQWKAIDLNVGTITLEASEVKDKERLVLPIHPVLCEKLKQWRKVEPITGQVFDYSYRKFRLHFNALCKVHNIHNATPHAMRHTFATRLVEQGVDIATVADLLGHSDSNFTRRTYVKTGHGHKLDAISKINLG